MCKNAACVAPKLSQSTFAFRQNAKIKSMCMYDIWLNVIFPLQPHWTWCRAKHMQKRRAIMTAYKLERRGICVNVAIQSQKWHFLSRCQMHMYGNVQKKQKICNIFLGFSCKHISNQLRDFLFISMTSSHVHLHNE